jgi:hypothetical protein
VELCHKIWSSCCAQLKRSGFESFGHEIRRGRSTGFGTYASP